MKNIRNIAILAHVDAGKTTLTENLLFNSGNIRTLGSVDKGTSHTDFLDIEKERGISVRTAYLSFKYNDLEINIVDTPGHTDFSSETERALSAVDSAILVISAVEGVQSHTETLWNAIQKMKIPCLIIINKIDRAGSDANYVFTEINKNLSSKTLILNDIIDEATDKVVITNNFNKENFHENNISEIIIENDEILFEKFMNSEDISFQELKKSFIKAVRKAELYPILYTSAKNNLGIDNVLNFIEEIFPSPQKSEKDELSGVIFKVEFDKTLGKLSYIRLLGGEIKSRELIYNQRLEKDEKVSQIKKIFTKKYEDISEFSSGDIAIVSGFSEAKAGDILGKKNIDLKNKLEGVPLLTVKVTPEKDSDYPTLLKAFRQISEQDPTIDLQWLQDQREFHIKIQGNIQVEILEKIIEQNYGIKANFEEPTIIYKETPAKAGEGYVRYWMPKPCWAIMRFKIEPLEQGSGVIYESKVSVDKIKKPYQNQVKNTIPKALKQGIKGWEVTDIKITLIDGEDHEVHTHPPDFIVATPMGIMDGLVNTDTILLEPILKFKITAPEEMLGTIASDLTKMRAVFANPEFENEKFTLEGKIPASESMNYAVSLASKTSGKGKISTSFDSYQKCDLELGKTCEFRGISPLDTSKYILHARKAL